MNTIVPSLQCFRSDPFGVPGNPYPFQPLKGWLSPSCSPSMGTQLLQQFTLMDNGVLQKLRKLQLIVTRFYNKSRKEASFL